jgi:hypothetical protein
LPHTPPVVRTNVVDAASFLFSVYLAPVATLKAFINLIGDDVPIFVPPIVTTHMPGLRTASQSMSSFTKDPVITIALFICNFVTLFKGLTIGHNWSIVLANMVSPNSRCLWNLSGGDVPIFVQPIVTTQMPGLRTASHSMSSFTKDPVITIALFICNFVTLFKGLTIGHNWSIMFANMVTLSYRGLWNPLMKRNLNAFMKR